MGQAESPLSDHSVLTAAEREQLLVEWNNTASAYPRIVSVAEVFHAQVARQPKFIARC